MHANTTSIDEFEPKSRNFGCRCERNHIFWICGGIIRCTGCMANSTVRYTNWYSLTNSSWCHKGSIGRWIWSNRWKKGSRNQPSPCHWILTYLRNVHNAYLSHPSIVIHSAFSTDCLHKNRDKLSWFKGRMITAKSFFSDPALLLLISQVQKHRYPSEISPFSRLILAHNCLFFSFLYFCIREWQPTSKDTLFSPPCTDPMDPSLLSTGKTTIFTSNFIPLFIFHLRNKHRGWVPRGATQWQRPSGVVTLKGVVVSPGEPHVTWRERYRDVWRE